MAEHVEFKPQMKGKDGDGKDDEAGAAAAEGNPEPAAEEQAPDEVEHKEAASF